MSPSPSISFGDCVFVVVFVVVVVVVLTVAAAAGRLRRRGMRRVVVVCGVKESYVSADKFADIALYHQSSLIDFINHLSL